MTTRRTCLQTLAAASFTASHVSPAAAPTWRMPDEAEPHTRTWMAFGASAAVWGRTLLPEVQRNLAAIALAIAPHEPVSMLVRPSDMAVAKRLMGSAIDLVPAALDDLWMRDTGPVFVHGPAGKAAIDFNFNGWGKKQAHTHDAKVAALVAAHTRTPVLSTTLVLEGGAIEVDGQGTAIITESCVLNANRNPGVSKAQVEAELQRLLGVAKIIWLPGIAGRDITDGHTDFYARFTSPGVVVAGLDTDPQSFDHAVTKRHLDILRQSTDAEGKPLQVHVMQAPTRVRNAFRSKDFAAGYINFYVCNGAVLAPQFGDARADAAALETLQALFPQRTVVQLNIDGIAAGGGGIHCTTQQEV
jgi:agmatine deiminase